MQSRHIPISGSFRASLLAIGVTLLVSLGLALAGPPGRFVSRGPGGGGAFFGPSINPFNPDEVWIGSDMSDLFYSADLGRTWDTVDFRVLQGGSQPGRMEFTTNLLVRYALNGSVPARSANGGVMWTRACDIAAAAEVGSWKKQAGHA